MTKTIFFVVAFLLAGVAQAAPICTIATVADTVTVTVADTGVVYRTDLGQAVPAGLVSYPGTGRMGDRSASCSDNTAFCGAAKWYLRFADSVQGWPGDEVVASDPRVVRCRYDSTRLAQVCEFKLAAAMKTPKGEVRMHYSAQTPAGAVVAAYQPQAGGCTVVEDAAGNPHTVLAPK